MAQPIAAAATMQAPAVALKRDAAPHETDERSRRSTTRLEKAVNGASIRVDPLRVPAGTDGKYWNGLHCEWRRPKAQVTRPSRMTAKSRWNNHVPARYKPAPHLAAVATPQAGMRFR